MKSLRTFPNIGQYESGKESSREDGGQVSID